MNESQVVNNCDLSTGRLREEDHKLKASLGYLGRPCLKTYTHSYIHPYIHTASLRAVTFTPTIFMELFLKPCNRFIKLLWFVITSFFKAKTFFLATQRIIKILLKGMVCARGEPPCYGSSLKLAKAVW